jgi:hypothetical protein
VRFLQATYTPSNCACLYGPFVASLAGQKGTLTCFPGEMVHGYLKGWQGRSERGLIATL